MRGRRGGKGEEGGETYWPTPETGSSGSGLQLLLHRESEQVKELNVAPGERYKNL